MAVVALKQRHFRNIKKTIRTQWHLLKPKLRSVKGKLPMHPEFNYGRMMGRRFRECLGGFAACGLLREIFSQSSSLSRAKRISSVYWLK
jgi:hypothetical protein